MFIPEYNEMEWDMQQPFLKDFAKKSVECFQFIQQFVKKTQVDLATTQLFASQMNSVQNKVQEVLLSTKQQNEQIDQKMKYLQLIIDQNNEQNTQQIKKFEEKLSTIEKLLQDKLENAQNEVENRVKKIQEVLQTKNQEIEYLASNFQQQSKEYVALGELFREQIAQFYSKQAIYSEDFQKIRQQLENAEQQTTKVNKEINAKILDMEQNFFVGLISRIMKCETETAKMIGNSDFIVMKSQENSDSIQKLLNAETDVDKRNAELQTKLVRLQNQLDANEKVVTEHAQIQDQLKTQIMRVKSCFEDSLLKQTLASARTSSEFETKLNYCISQMSAMDEDIQRKIAYCNNQVAQSGLNEKYNVMRKKKYEDDLEVMLKQGVLEVGQVKFVQAIVIRVQELENLLMQHLNDKSETK